MQGPPQLHDHEASIPVFKYVFIIAMNEIILLLEKTIYITLKIHTLKKNRIKL